MRHFPIGSYPCPKDTMGGVGDALKALFFGKDEEEAPPDPNAPPWWVGVVAIGGVIALIIYIYKKA